MNREATSYIQIVLPSNNLEVVAQKKHVPISLSQVVTVANKEFPCNGIGIEDESLLEELKTGSQDALAILFRRYARMVRSVAYRILRNESEADDLVQEVFLFVFRRANLFDAKRGTARSWIVQVTYHRAIDRRRYLASRYFYTSSELDDRTLADEVLLESKFYETSIEGRLGKVTLQEIEKSLSEEQRRVLELYFYEGFAMNEIAEEMSQTVGNVRNYYYRGLEKMRRHIFGATYQTK